jgi:hypothetical protein
MQPVESKAAVTVGFRSEDSPLVFTCTDFTITCCQHCHSNNYILAVYPWTVFTRASIECQIWVLASEQKSAALCFIM